MARSSPSTKIRPEVMVSNPAIMRSKVDLPQPELPSKANNSFLAIDKLTLSTAVLSPNFFTTFSIRINSSVFVFVAVAGRTTAALLFEGINFMV